MPSISQASSIAAELRDDILSGLYRCGERLPSERDLAGRFGVHRSTVREAFKRLEQLGVARIHPGGARVAPLEEASLEVVGHLLALDNPPDPEILDQALEATSGFRAMAARLGTERANAAQRARMLGILDQMMGPEIEGGDPAEWVAELGECLVEASGNVVLKLMQHGLGSRLSRTPGAPDLFRARPNKSEVDAHLKRLATAIESADGATASDAVYNLSCLYRQNVREFSSKIQDASQAPKRMTGEGARS